MTCAGTQALNMCAFIMTCLQPQDIQHLLYYCAFIWGASLIFAYGVGPPKIIGPREGRGGEQHIIVQIKS